MKRLLSVILTIAMLLQTMAFAVPSVVTVEDAMQEISLDIIEEEIGELASNKCGRDFTDNFYIANKLDSLFEILPYGSYPYFTTYGNKSCNCEDQSCPECSAKNVVNEHPILKNLGLDSSMVHGATCFGFAQFAYYYIFGLKTCDAYGSGYGTVSQTDKIPTLKRIFQLESYSVDSCKEAFKQARAGDVIQGYQHLGYYTDENGETKESYTVHTMIYLGPNDADSFWVIDGNWSRDDKVTIHTVTYKKFTNGWNSRASVYTCPDEYYPKSGTYNIVSALNNESSALDIVGGSSDNKANVHLWTRHSGDSQKFKIELVDDTYYKITNVNSGKVLDVDGASTENGTNVFQYDWQNTDNQLWAVEDAGDGYYYIKSKLGVYLDVDDADYDDGTNIQVWEGNQSSAQKFKLIAPHVHSYTIGYDSAHPHNQYKICSCGEKIYTGNTRLVATCSQCITLADIEEEDYYIKNGSYYINVITDTNAKSTLNASSTSKSKFSAILDGSYYILEYADSSSGNVINCWGSSSSDGAEVTLWSRTTGEEQRWYFEEYGNGYLIHPGDNVNLSLTRDTSTNKLYVKTTTKASNQIWTLESETETEPETTMCTVTFDVNGGSGYPDGYSFEVVAGNYYSLLSKEPTRTGYTFLGWSTSATGNVKWTSDDDFYTYEDVTLYARWSANRYTVTFDANGGTVSTNSISVKTDNAYGTLPTPTRTGYKFVGWYTAKSNGTQITSSTVVKLSANQTLYAQWQANTYKVKYNANGGSGSMSSSTHTFDTAKALTANAFTRSGYTFLGWSTNSSATSATYTDKQSVKNLAATDGSTANLYAVWSEKYHVCYSANGGSNIPEIQWKTSGEALEISDMWPTRDGFEFLNWTNHFVSLMPEQMYYDDASLCLFPVWSATGENDIVIEFTEDETHENYHEFTHYDNKNSTYEVNKTDKELVVTSEALSGTPDPAVLFPFLLFYAKDYPYIVVNAKMEFENENCNLMQIFFDTVGDASYSEANSVKSYFYPTVEDEFKNYVFDMSQLDSWSGRIYNLRLDPFNGCEGKCVIKSITLMTECPESEASVKLNKTSTQSLKPGESVTLKATASSSDAKITWISTDESVATVKNGVVTAVGEGSAAIIARTHEDVLVEYLSGETYTENNPAYTTSANPIQVVKNPLDSSDKVLYIESNKQGVAAWTYFWHPYEYKAGQKYLIKFKFLMGNDVYGNKVEYETLGINMRTNGRDNGFWADCQSGEWKEYAYIHTMPDEAIDLTKENKFGIYANPTTVDGYDHMVAWSYYIDDVIIVPYNGMLQDGWYNGASDWFADSATGCVVTVEPDDIPVTKVTLNKSVCTLKIGGTATLSATVKPTDATNKTVTWTSSNASVAMVENGIVTAIGKGSAIITATSHNGLTATCTINVQIPADTVEFTSLQATSLAVGKNLTLKATAFRQDGEKPDSAAVIYEIVDGEEIATIDAKGKLTAIDCGTVVVRATSEFGTETAYADIEITIYNPATKVTLNKTKASMAVGGADLQLTATLSPENSTDTITWSVDNEDVATVDENGLVTAHSAGKVKVTATAGSGKKATCTITVGVPADTVEFTSLKSTSLAVGKTLSLKAKAYCEDGTKPVSTAVVFEIIDGEEYATLDAKGKLKGIATGEVTVRATAEAGTEEAYAEVTINVCIPATKVKLDKTKASMVVGGEDLQLTAILSPENHTDTITWTSANEEIATVDENGLVTAHSAGKVKITAMSGSGKKATCTVTVGVPATRVDVTALKTKSVAVGKSITIKGKAACEGKTKPVSTAVVFEIIEGEDLATINAKGKLTAIAEGTVVVRVSAEAGTEDAYEDVEINICNPATKVTLNIKKATVTIGDELELKATMTAKGECTDTLTWSVDKPAIATVDENGVVTAHSAGKVKVTATAGSGKKATCTVTVTE